MAAKNLSKKTKSLDGNCRDLPATQILFLLADTMFKEIDKNGTIRYSDYTCPTSFVFKTKRGRNIAVLAMDVNPLMKKRAPKRLCKFSAWRFH